MKYIYLRTIDILFREVRGGRRIGLYRIKGELGIGNFSRVKLAQHELTRGKLTYKIIIKFYP